MTARQKLAAAELATRKAREHESQAMDALKAAGRINYLGILLERWTEAGLIATAIGPSGEGARREAASWPTDADYDEAERESSEEEPPTETVGG